MKQETLEQFRKEYNKYYSILSMNNSELEKLLEEKENDPRQKKIEKYKETIEILSEKIEKLEKELDEDPKYSLIEEASWTLFGYAMFRNYDNCGYSSQEEFAYNKSKPEIAKDETYGYLLCVVPSERQEKQIYEYYDIEDWGIEYKIQEDEVESFERNKKIIHLPSYTTPLALSNFKKHFCMKLLEQNPEEAFNTLFEEYDINEKQKRLSRKKSE